MNREYPEFTELYYECGGNLRQLNLAGMSGVDESEDSLAKMMLIRLIGKIWLKIRGGTGI